MAVGSKSGSNLAIGSLYYHWNHIWAVGSTWAWSGPSDHAAWRRVNIAKKLAIYGRLIANISTIYCHQKRFFHKIVDLSPRADISLTYQWFLRKYLPSDFSPRNIVSTPFDTQYIDDISPIYPDIFLLDYHKQWGTIDEWNATFRRGTSPKEWKLSTWHTSSAKISASTKSTRQLNLFNCLWR